MRPAMTPPNVRLRTRLLNLFRAPLRARSIDRLIARATEGKDPRSLWARVAPGNALYRRPALRSAVRRGIAYELDISDFMEWVIYYGIVTEPRAKLFSLAHQGATVIDVGANVGECTLNFARHVGTKGSVLALEPDPVVRAKLQRNVALNPFANIEIVPLALGAEPGRLELSTVAPSNRGGNRILERPVGEHVTVQVVPLDQMLEERPVARVDLIKIDVEGFELNVLKGAKRTIERFRPTLFVEVSDGNLRASGTSARELVQLMKDHGYRLRHAEDDSAVSPDDSFDGRHFDVIATVP
jgi:FkbM family methyltransferase